jgi:protein-tyrosine phosphatase
MTLMGFIDIHCHILPGLDDGPESVEESLDMVRMAASDGTSHMFCTPHVYPDVYDNNADSIKRARDELKNKAPNGVKLFFGGDVRITPDLVERLARQEVPTLNDSPYLLLEFPSQMIPHYTSRLIFNLRQNGLLPIVSHPERCIYFAKDFTGLKVLRDLGCMFQLTAMSLTKDVPKEVRKVTYAMIENGFADFIASDAHSTGHRAPVLSMAYHEVQRRFGKDLAEKLFFKNPQKILDSVTE